MNVWDFVMNWMKRNGERKKKNVRKKMMNISEGREKEKKMKKYLIEGL